MTMVQHIQEKSRKRDRRDNDLSCERNNSIQTSDLSVGRPLVGGIGVTTVGGVSNIGGVGVTTVGGVGIVGVPSMIPSVGMNSVGSIGMNNVGSIGLGSLGNVGLNPVVGNPTSHPGNTIGINAIGNVGVTSVGGVGVNSVSDIGVSSISGGVRVNSVSGIAVNSPGGIGVNTVGGVVKVNSLGNIGVNSTGGDGGNQVGGTGIVGGNPTLKPPNMNMFDTYQPWVLQTYGDTAKTKTITRNKYQRILQILRGDYIDNETSKFKLWVKGRGFRIGPPPGYFHPGVIEPGMTPVNQPGVDYNPDKDPCPDIYVQTGTIKVK